MKNIKFSRTFRKRTSVFCNTYANERINIFKAGPFTPTRSYTSFIFFSCPTIYPIGLSKFGSAGSNSFQSFPFGISTEQKGIYMQILWSQKNRYESGAEFFVLTPSIVKGLDRLKRVFKRGKFCVYERQYLWLHF